MTTVVPIDSDKIVEILFENSEEIPNDVYINMMDLMKRYHEREDNEQEIRSYIRGIDNNVLKIFQKYIYKEKYFSCVCSFERYFATFCIIILIFVSMAAGLCYLLSKGENNKNN
jgi:hypothetical protein